MPLVRVEVRNEYGLGMPELYKEANKEDPKALLEGVAVAGLVGILRQLGDLAEFAAEVFHGLQEQVMNTSSRSHKLMVRVQNIEAAFPPLENTILAQRSHLHFAYTTGLQWHVRIQSERNHFIYSDLPRFVMDSYEECRGPPRLHLLDKFDTGGPGSCVKRYSDPTFFRRASAGFDEAYVEKVPRNKKARRRKKKKTWLKNGEVPHGVSHGTLISSHSGRMQYDSRNFDGQTSSQTVSTFNAALKSELAEHSFDSRAGSGYIECILSPSYSMKPDGCEPEEISSQLKLHHSDTLDTSSLGEQSGVVNDDIQEQTDTRSSCVTWDEKTEIMEPTGLQYQFDETTEKLPTNFNPDPPEGEAVNIRTADQMEFNFDNESMLASVSCGNQLDDIESETDNYMDALNTIESESEIDLECQTKREVEQFSSLNNKEADGETNKLTPPRYLDSRSSNSETHVPAHVSSNKAISEENHNSVIPESPKAANSFLNKETSITKPNSVPSEFYATEHSPQEAGKSSSLDTLPDIDSSGSDEILDGSNVETVVRNLSSSVSRKPILQAPKSDTILSSSCESQKSPSLPSGVTGVNFWTNGGLLGLEPSKPPDFSVLNSGNHESMAKSKGETFLPSSRSTILEGDRNALKTNIIENSDFHHSVSSNKPQKLVFSETSTKIPGTEEAINPDVQATKSWEYDGKNSSRMFEFSNRLLVNGFQKKVSHFGDGNLVGSVKNGVSEQKSGSQAYKTFPGRNFKEQFGCGSPFMSPSSPPLEHMKISFQPIDGFETHKLKLKLPDGSECHESSGDMFPSFQLVPEKSISLQDLGSDSDDDTFCRSSPHPSDDCLSHYSESDSEEWETGESPKCKDHEIYDALGPESVSSNLEIGRMAVGVIVGNYGLQSPFTENGMEPSHSGRLHDLPSFDTLNTSLGEELHRNSDAKYPLESDFSKEPTPSPPPLPPVEWCAMNPNPDVAIEKQDSPFEAVKHAFDQKLSAFTISHQPKPAPVKHDQNTEAIACTTKSKQLDLQKLNGQNDADQPSNSKGVDEKEDFLQQIRTKSFSLRRTMTDRQTTTPGAPTNVSVTAILEKANAIRQAVGSDDGEDDDTWSYA